MASKQLAWNIRYEDMGSVRYRVIERKGIEHWVPLESLHCNAELAKHWCWSSRNPCQKHELPRAMRMLSVTPHTSSQECGPTPGYGSGDGGGSPD